MEWLAPGRALLSLRRYHCPVTVRTPLGPPALRPASAPPRPAVLARHPCGRPDSHAAALPCPCAPAGAAKARLLTT